MNKRSQWLFEARQYLKSLRITLSGVTVSGKYSLNQYLFIVQPYNHKFLVPPVEYSPMQMCEAIALMCLPKEHSSECPKILPRVPMQQK